MLPIREALRRERERRYGAALRAYLAELGEEQWPPWPPSADAGHCAWVREHWSLLASDRFDALLEVLGRHGDAELRVLAQELADCEDDAPAVAACLARFSRPVWEEGEAPASWRRWIEEHWREGEADELLRELGNAERTRSWSGDHRERLRERERAELDELTGLLRFDLTEEEMAPLLADRVTGVRGRYRVTGHWQEVKAGITAADIDAP